MLGIVIRMNVKLTDGNHVVFLDLQNPLTVFTTSRLSK